MLRRYSKCAAGLLLAALLLVPDTTAGQAPAMIRLPAPVTEGGMPLARALATRRSTREFATASLRLADVSQLLWAAQGITVRQDAPPGWQWGPWQGGLRTAPSAGALFPLEVYVLAANVEGLERGVYHYVPREHGLTRTGDCEAAALSAAALGQRAVAQAPAVFVVSGVYERTRVKYGTRTERYVQMEAGAAAENLLLQAVALGLGGVYIGAFRDELVSERLALPAEHAPLVILAVGKPPR